MSKVKENIVERYIHFLVIGVAGVLSVLLLFAGVIKSPNAVEVGRDKLGPGEIDREIHKQAKMIEQKLNSEPEPVGRYVEKFEDFKDIYAMSIEDFEDFRFPIPGAVGSSGFMKRSYDLPAIAELKDVEISHMRAVAHLPLYPVGLDNTYDQLATNVDDVDIVTVEAQFDLSELKENFEKTFNSANLRKDWRDEELAKIIFAKVELQRQRLLDDGSWGEWEIVPRTKVDQYSELMDYAEKFSELEKGIDVLRLQFQSNIVWSNLLQPQVYEIAQSNLSWYPPSLFGIYEKQQKELERERIKALRESQRGDSDRDRKREPRTPARTTDTGTRPTSPTTRPDDRRTRRPVREEDKDSRSRKQIDVDVKFAGMLIPDNVEADQLVGDLTMWACDDTAEPDNTYRYRLRYAVFNPVAGMDWYKQQYKDYSDSVVLWSNYTEPTESIYVAGKEYIFPIDKTSRGVVVEVAKYELGKWRKHEFLVNVGDQIGGIVEEVVLESAGSTTEDSLKVEKTQEVDYRTGAVFVEIREVEDQIEVGNTLRSVSYEEMLYKKGNQEIKGLPIRERYWPDNLKNAFKEVKDSLDKVVEITQRGSSSAGSKRVLSPRTGAPDMGRPGGV